MQNDLSIFLGLSHINKRDVKNYPKRVTSLAYFIKDSTTDATWKGFSLSFLSTVSELKSVFLFKNVENSNIYFRLHTAYLRIIWRNLSIDLVAASLRQREFAKKITSEECQGINTPFALSKAVIRYYKFLLLLKESKVALKKPHTIVPTLDIDLCWHTHQLYPVSYRSWCYKHIRSAINHDDTINKKILTDELRLTSLAWLETYNEPYTTDDLKTAYLTPGRKVAGIIFPPYGLHILKKSRKLGQAQAGISKPLFVFWAIPET